VVLAVAGCGVARGAFSTAKSLGDAGFANPNIEIGSGDSVRVTVTKDTEDLGTAAAEAARIVWHKLPLRIEDISVTCSNGFGGRGTFTADRALLESRFGARDPALDEGFQEKDARTAVVVVLVLLGGGLLVLAGIVLLIVVLVRRNRRGSPPPPPPPPPGAPGPPGPPPGWGTQPPPPGYRP